MIPSDYAEVVLSMRGRHAGEPWRPGTRASRSSWPTARSCLNLPLVNHEHRKLAGKLIEQLDRRARRWSSWRAAAGGPPIRSDSRREPAAWRSSISGRPVGSCLHLAVVGILFCFSRCPSSAGPWTRDGGRRTSAATSTPWANCRTNRRRRSPPARLATTKSCRRRRLARSRTAQKGRMADVNKRIRG